MTTLQEVMDDPTKLDMHDAEAHAAIMKEIAALDGEPPKDGPKEEPKVEAEAGETKEAKADPEVKGENEPEAKPAEEQAKPTAILAPDGKSTIPYAVLQSERQQRATLEKSNGELSEMVVSLNERIKKLEAGDTTSASETGDLRAEVTALADEAPALAGPLAKVVEKLDALEKKQHERDATDEERAEQEAERVRQEVLTHIDNNPALTHWRAERPDLWNEAVEFDSILQKQAAWQGKPMADRFAHLVNVMVANHDDSILPATAVKEVPAAPTKVDPAAALKAAEAKLAAATPTVTTLSDLPAGAAPEQSEQEQAENISITQLWSKFERMTPDQQAAYLRSVTT